uniref:Uncharacterized protein n=1 Tax=viral metagenome TaxID=1070528 RepID=A0A6M3LFS8_9ZZZZ
MTDDERYDIELIQKAVKSDPVAFLDCQLLLSVIDTLRQQLVEARKNALLEAADIVSKWCLFQEGESLEGKLRRMAEEGEKK